MTVAMDVKALGKVAVLMGGDSSERDVSLVSGMHVLETLRECGVDAHAVDLGETPLSDLLAMGVDRVFIALHGGTGENGRIQGTLESFGLPYTGSGILASALAMDKYRSKLTWQALGLSVPKAVLITQDMDIHHVVKQLGLPLVVKPIFGGSSHGVSIVNTIDDFPGALLHANTVSSHLMVEQYIAGREFTVGVFGDKVLPAIELHVDRPFYDFKAKYYDVGTYYQPLADLTSKLAVQLEAIVSRAYHGLGCRDYARLDLIKDQDDQFWLLEANTIPGLRTGGTFCAALQAANIPFSTFLLTVLAKQESHVSRCAETAGIRNYLPLA